MRTLLAISALISVLLPVLAFAQLTGHSSSAPAFGISGVNRPAQLAQVLGAFQSSFDTTPPIVSIVNSPHGLTVSGLVQIQANVADTSGILIMALEIDGAIVGQAASEPYLFQWDSTKVANGRHVMTVVALDRSGNRGRISAEVIVNNAAGSASQPATAPIAVPKDPVVELGAKIAVSNEYVNVRGIAGTNGRLFGRQTKGAGGIVIDGPVAAGGLIWWKIDYDAGADGWSVRDYIMPVVFRSSAAAQSGILIGGRIKVASAVNVRTVASVSGALLGTHPAGAAGKVVDGPVAAGGYEWWRIDYDAYPDGWSVGKFLTKE